MDLKSASAVIKPKAGTSFDPTKIPKAVKDAGFTPGDIEVTAVGTLKTEGDLLLLEMYGPVPRFVLAGGQNWEELKRRSDFVSKRLQVRGKLHPYHADRPPGLTVERFEIPAK
ncbi:MAG: hypothetical protein L0387_22770 [Acidobacteria bacterium]|nr:hypothetical protein [Acidobacteriota bacterium]